MPLENKGAYEKMEVRCPVCGASFRFVELVVKSDAWLIRDYDGDTGSFVPTSVVVFDHTEMTCPLCREDFQDGEIEDLIEWGSADTVEVI